MALEKIEMNGGVPIQYWRVSHVKSYDPDAKQAVVAVKGYFNAATRKESNEHFKVHEFLIANSSRIDQVTRPATLAEKKEQLNPDLIKDKSDAEIKKIAHDILVEEKVVPLPYFDEFQKLYEKGKWMEASYAYLKSGAAHINGFFTDAVDA